MATQQEIDIAYKYPFSEEAKRLIAEKGQKQIEYRYVELGKSRLQADIEGKVGYFSIAIDNVKLGYVISYIYARMLASAIGLPQVVDSFAEGEAARSAKAAGYESALGIERLASGLGMHINASGESEFTVSVFDYLKKMPDGNEYKLVNSRLEGGFIVLSRTEAVGLLRGAMKLRILEGMPIPKDTLPKDIIEAAKGISLAKKRQYARPSAGTSWIEKLLATPIPDVRHRVVNLILAPYFVNVKGLDVEEAEKLIIDYIEQCKKLDPNTNISDTYIAYQCNYSKKKGTKPLSFSKAKELLGGMVDFSSE
ncbi:DNA primase noncatalytic subunit PriX [Candidatus Marsarchaeota archaeon]|nr:DNA primase noncatalytic subunit PriX [Candidatus Marsarchaeota archaeon]MCL5404819.1 DNA primase noncatalytic subunit PriX [Candidatus Marsarchaeota archaeon]